MSKIDELPTKNVGNNARTACLKVSQTQEQLYWETCSSIPQAEQYQYEWGKKKKKRIGKKGRKKGGEKGTKWDTVHVITV